MVETHRSSATATGKRTSPSPSSSSVPPPKHPKAESLGSPAASAPGRADRLFGMLSLIMRPFKVSGDLYMINILHVVLWFTEEAAQHEESEVMDGEDDDDEDEDDDDYDTKKNKGTAGGEGQQGKRPTKCKQQ
ncbi:hypothetical protein Zm00014a_014167 [Zea mays]|uniref:Uncharacterized protein n=1 Tax=Zea mays TaxID=4577 RepID=A0A3L6FH48_MAIZE|nr:hypothetical protein Zm00014a_014167 [Zea mays]